MVDFEAVKRRHEVATEVGRKLQNRSLELGDHNALFASCSDIPELLDYIAELEKRAYPLLTLESSTEYGVRDHEAPDKIIPVGRDWAAERHSTHRRDVISYSSEWVEK